MSHHLKHGLICAVQKYVHSSGSLRRDNQLSLSGTPTGETVFNFTHLQLNHRPQELRRQKKGKKLFQAEVPARESMVFLPFHEIELKKGIHFPH